MDIGLLFAMGALLLAIGAFAGLLAGLLGVGGGIVLVPAFFYAFSALGYESEVLMQVCLATSLATIIVTSIRSVLSHNKRGAVDWGVLRGWAPGIVIGALVGVFVATALRTAALQAIFGILAMIVAAYMVFGRSSWRLGPQMPTGPARWALSPGIGFLSVLMGIGGGSFGVPVMSLYGMAIHRAVATAAGFGVLIAVPSVAVFLLTPLPAEVTPPWTIGAVNLVAFALVIAMTLITAPMGAALAHRTDAARLKRIFGLFLFLVAANMLRKAAGF
ncbi:sulfite exporter TauE/SafE family protein [Pseudoroseicyclus tamaricis]|uniref:Probable membrane transporter protein n=1 Tax=Pseudoroseicyclus tamaricis TaxID=2705421 RepID=A0A6B2JHK5_9RHOB|nr:sulfite exporter TauE/SafE family protein [Pseudoroseicyclus tamaricis]NDV00743.1 sulfite exporter TauE/SafE family protein [Pseudoroseicyclus tamaricis]